MLPSAGKWEQDRNDQGGHVGNRVPHPDFRRVFDEAPAPFLLLTPDLVIVHANRARLEATASTLEDTVGRKLFDVFPMNPDDPAADGLRNLRASLRRVVASGQPETMAIQKYDIPMPDGTYEERYWSPRNVPILDDDGEVVFVLHQSDDITDYVHLRASGSADAETAEGLRQRVQQVELDLFARTRELETTNARLRDANERDRRTARSLAQLARTATELAHAETVADVIAHCLERGFRVAGADHATLALRHGDTLRLFDGGPQGIASARSGQDVPLDAAALPAAVAAQGQRLLSVHSADVMEEQPHANDQAEGAQSLANQGAPTWVALPLRTGDQMLGSLTLTWTAWHRFDDTELHLLDALARQYAQALERVRRLEGERERAAVTQAVAETLQRALLSNPPQPDHGQIVVRYTPASRTAKIGGDWYDAFMQRDGATVLVIGDVTGHDTNATAAMGELRSLLRGIAVTTSAGPAAILTEVDRGLQTLQAETIATAVVARVEQTPLERRHGVTRVRWSNAGHPPPVVLRPDGTVDNLTGPRNDVLLGVAPHLPRAETVVTLQRGTTLLLYTDGLVERRHQALDARIDHLRDTVRTLHRPDVDLDTLCDGILARMLPTHPDDDVALIAIRFHSQSEPRPPEAGPNTTPPDVPPEPEEDNGTSV